MRRIALINAGVRSSPELPYQLVHLLPLPATSSPLTSFILFLSALRTVRWCIGSRDAMQRRKNTLIPEKRSKGFENVSMLPPQNRRLMRTSQSLAAHNLCSSHPEDPRNSGKSDPHEGIASGNMRESRLSPAPQEVTLRYTSHSGQISTADKNISGCTPDSGQTITQNHILQ